LFFEDCLYYYSDSFAGDLKKNFVYLIRETGPKSYYLEEDFAYRKGYLENYCLEKEAELQK